MVGLYLIYSIDNHNKCYVGSSINIKRRLYQHFYQLKNNKHTNAKLQNFVNKYGIDKLNYCILSTYDKSININELREKEYNEIIIQNGLNGFNISSITKGSNLSPEGKLRISNKAKERQSSNNYKNSLSIKYSGTNSITSKLKKEDIEYIKKNAIKIESRYKNISKLANKFNVSNKTIYRVLHNLTYKRD